MLDYAVMSRWTSKHDLLMNRVGIINEIHGCAHHTGLGNPCRVWWDSGGYVCEYLGSELCRWRLYDLDGLSAAYGRVDALADALWRIRRGGCLRV